MVSPTVLAKSKQRDVGGKRSRGVRAHGRVETERGMLTVVTRQTLKGGDEGTGAGTGGTKVGCLMGLEVRDGTSGSVRTPSYRRGDAQAYPVCVLVALIEARRGRRALSSRDRGRAGVTY